MDLLSEFSQLVSVPQRTSSHLVTAISRVLQPHDGRIRCLEDRNFDHIIFLLIFGDNVEIIVNKICF